jgi:hypothetical protein
MKKTALQRAVLVLKKRQWLYEGVDDEKASIIEECILDIENYLDVEQKHIMKAYKDGLDDMQARHHWRPKDYFENNFKQQDK